MFVQFLTKRVFILLPTKQLSPSFRSSEKKYIYINKIIKKYIVDTFTYLLLLVKEKILLLTPEVV